jgi:hypothetical protein
LQNKQLIPIKKKRNSLSKLPFLKGAETKISPTQNTASQNGRIYGVHFGFVKVLCLHLPFLPHKTTKPSTKALIKASNPCQSARFLRDMDNLKQFT